jgi:hypothetical protein
MAEPEKTETEVQDPKKKNKKPLDVSRGSTFWVAWNFVEAMLLLVAGILAIVYNANEGLQDTIIRVVGIFMIIGGSLRILMNFMPVIATSATEEAAKIEARKNLSYNFVVGGSIELAMGITLTAMSSSNDVISAIVEFLSLFIGIVCIVGGVSFLLFAIAFIISKLYKLYMPILEIIFGCALIALGSVVIVYMSDKQVFMQVVLIIVGIVMILTSLGIFVDTIKTMSDASKDRKEKEAKDEAAAPEETASAEMIDLTKQDGAEKKPDDKNQVVDAKASDKPADPKK